LTFGFGIIILQGVSSRISLAGVNIMFWFYTETQVFHGQIQQFEIPFWGNLGSDRVK
jgi:hypothetical protein